MATYYFDASDAIASDPNSAWTNDGNAFDGSTATTAQTSSHSSVSSNFLMAEGTNAPASGSEITNVKMRIYGSGNSLGDTAKATAYTDGLIESLGEATQTGTGYGSYVTLSVPTGGWTWGKVQSLEVKIYATIADTNVDVSKVELEVYSDSIPGGIYRVQGYQ
jgi:hypothetical protein